MTAPQPDLPPLATPDQYQDLVGAPPAGQDLETLLAAASDLVRDTCGWHVAPSITETIRMDGSGTADILLPTLHLTDVLAVTESGTTVESDTLEWSEVGILRRGAYTRWTTALRGVQATIKHGYPTPSGGLIALVCTVAARASVSPTGVTRTQVGPVSESYSQSAPNVAGGTSLLQHEVEYLAKFTLPSRP